MANTIEKECLTHGLTTFVYRTDDRYRCRKCSIDAVAKTRRKLKAQAVEYKGGKCCKCGYNKSVWALQFHHNNPEEKDFSIGSDIRSWKRMQPELDKCVLVCANCHAELHEQLYENQGEKA